MEDRGCAVETSIPIFEIEGEEYYRCPQTLLTIETRRSVGAFVLLKQGVLPTEGGWLEQAATFIDIVQVLDGHIETTMKKLREEEERKRSREQRKWQKKKR